MASAAFVLAPFYGWFTEGFNTLKLKQIKAPARMTTNSKRPLEGIGRW
jgi:hypothetical protein